MRIGIVTVSVTVAARVTEFMSFVYIVLDVRAWNCGNLKPQKPQTSKDYNIELWAHRTIISISSVYIFVFLVHWVGFLWNLESQGGKGINANP